MLPLRGIAPRDCLSDCGRRRQDRSSKASRARRPASNGLGFAALLDETAEGAFGAGASRREQNRRHRSLGILWRAVDALPQSARGVSAFEGNRRHQEVRERVKKVEADAGKHGSITESRGPLRVSREEVLSSSSGPRSGLPTPAPRSRRGGERRPLRESRPAGSQSVRRPSC